MKSRIWIWIIVIICAVLFTQKDQIINHIKDAKANEKNITLSVDTKDTFISNAFITTKNYDGIKFKMLDSMQKSTSADVIIRTHSNEEIEGYNLYSEKLYSPFVMLSSYSGVTNGNLIEIEIDGQYNAFEKNVKNVLDVLDKGGTISEIGLAPENSRKDYTLKVYIPDETSPYYEEVVKFLYVGYFDTPTTDENLAEREAFINKILDKCTKVENIVEFAKSPVKEGVVIIPEYVAFSHYSSMLSSSNNSVIYPQRTNYIAYDILIRKDVGNGDGSLEKSIISAFENSSKLYKLTYLRVQNRTYSELKQSPYSRTIERLNMVRNDDYFPNDFEINKTKSSSNRILAEDIEPTKSAEPIEEDTEIVTEEANNEVEESKNEETESKEEIKEEEVDTLEETTQADEEVSEEGISEEQTSEELNGEKSDGANIFGIFLIILLIGGLLFCLAFFLFY